MFGLETKGGINMYFDYDLDCQSQEMEILRADLTCDLHFLV